MNKFFSDFEWYKEYMYSTQKLLSTLGEQKVWSLARRLNMSMNDIPNINEYYVMLINLSNWFMNGFNVLHSSFCRKQNKIKHIERSRVNRKVYYSTLDFMKHLNICMDVQSVILSFIY